MDIPAAGYIQMSISSRVKMIVVKCLVWMCTHGRVGGTVRFRKDKDTECM